VDPRMSGFHMTLPAHAHDFGALLRQAIENHRLRDAVRELAPPLSQYGLLRTHLARYRTLTGNRAIRSPAPFTSVVHPGDQFAESGALYDLLRALGDLQADAARPIQGAYEGALVEGVRRFQGRHGLTGDGVIGKATQSALQVPLGWRVRQIELALERLRWLPDLAGSRLVAVNIPMFRLWGWDAVRPEAPPAIGMGVIVGRAMRTQTPVFIEELRYVVFRPYWNVPPSILRNEVLPKIIRDPEYLGRENMEVVRGAGDDARVVRPTPENIELLRQGLLRVRQRPGSGNALGLIKFVFPNDYDVYMHGTPAPALFQQSRRDFSHGCVRLEDPVALAEWALKDTPGWTREKILAALNGADSQRADLTAPVRVIMFYTTAVAMPEDGTIHFADDLYGFDAKLDRALGRRSP
jgi:L,D-transpeptidase YcbB